MTAITLTASDGFTLDAWRAEPAGAPRGGVVVVQEIFGVNSHIRSVCDRLAGAGYVAVAPAIFDRIEPGFETGYSPEQIEVARGLMGRFDMAKCLLDIAAARDSLAGTGKIGVVGFCLGGSVAYAAASQLDGFAAASSFYGGMVNKLIGNPPRCPVQFHYGALDAGIPPENYNAVRSALPQAEFHVYDRAGHGFNCDQRGSYAPEAAALAWQRMLEFFARTLD
ncbi:MAG: dienelactone hydrolase family protein [Rhodobacteraceae bacterium]|nr:dienelactone hydrolase family protein [Paracoccaceae bacterium]